jgi:Putative MetA-pathway of phenol degradation
VRAPPFDLSLVGSRLAVARRLICFALALLADRPAVALAQQTAPAQPPEASSQDQGGGPTGDALNALNLLQLFYSVKTAPGSGPNGTIRTVTTDTFKLRGDARIDLGPDWQLALRGDLPYLAKDPVNSSNPDGDFLYGLGDADVQAALVHAFNSRWTAGLGARLIMPTGDASLGSGKWQIMPIAGVRYALSEISSGSYVEPLVRYDASFAGDPAKRTISNLQFAPMVNFALPDRWFVTIYPTPDIRWNFGPPVTGQTGRLFLPIDVRFGRKITENATLSLEIGVPIVKQYPVYDFKTEARLNLTF